MKVLGKEVSWKGRFLEIKVLGKGGFLERKVLGKECSWKGSFLGKEGSWKERILESKILGKEGSWKGRRRKGSNLGNQKMQVCKEGG